MAAAGPKPELLVIVGPTASGKSDLALKIAKDCNGEIIAADSWTVYRGFDIGTSKPTITQQKAVKHHLIDVREASDGFNAPLFKELALIAIDDIQKRGKLPILAGGTGLYIDSVIYNFGFLPDVPREARAKLDALTIEDLLRLAQLQGIDLVDIDTRNKRRIIRAIEAKGQKPTKAGLRPGTLMLGIKVDNDGLRQKIVTRTDLMFKAGLEQEVKALAAQYGWDTEPMKGIGYREWREYFQGTQTLEETRQRIISATMGLAKRQRTWFKRNPDIQWFDSIDAAAGYASRILQA
jgi:tRNA dimethylallyltransferase